MAVLLRQVRWNGNLVDLRATPAGIEAIGPDLPGRPGDEVVDGRGGAIIPGLHDHHLHLLAVAAAHASVRVGPPEVVDPDGLARALAAADRALAPGAWLRGVGYHESVAGPLDRGALDRLIPGRPVRIQHRSGAEWVVNSVAAEAIGLDRAREAGIERDPDGHPTGRLRRLDGWLRDRVRSEPADLASVGQLLARQGITGVTDATPFDSLDGFAALADAVRRGQLPQRVMVTGGPSLTASPVPAELVAGPVKVVLADPDLPGLDEVTAWFVAAHAAGRAVAVHCVTRAALVLALAAWNAAVPRPGDRIEHAAVVPPELADGIRERGLTVVTQPGFIAERGDRYLVEVEPVDRLFLYPCHSLIERGIPVGGSTDAPFGNPDPWGAIRAATTRRTADGVMLGPDERITPAQALGLFLTAAEDPGGPPRRIAPGQPADLVLLDDSLERVLAEPDRAHVTATIHAGRLTYHA